MYYVCATTFGWTPSQVNELPAELLDRLMVIHMAVKEEEERAMRRARNG